ncbi:MAG: hypothetical protein M3R48_07875 [Candidatus Dormibacteraeota bacterium]|nr:hypothetical protein [Candidatus Dormibacteraeota bacterium]
MNTPQGLPAALRAMADNLSGVVSELTKVINSVASSLEAANAADERAPRSKPERKAPKGAKAHRAARKTTTARAPSTTAASVSDETVRAAMEQLGAATSAQIAGHINAAAGSKVVDGRAIRAHAGRVGATVVMRRGQRLYRL